MWIKKHRSFFMLVRVRIGFRGFAIPLPLFLLDQTLDAITDLVWLWEKFNPRGAERLHQQLNRSEKLKYFQPTNSLSQVLRLCRKIVNELRRHGHWRMAEVEKNKTKVYVDFI